MLDLSNLSAADLAALMFRARLIRRRPATAEFRRRVTLAIARKSL